MTISTCHVGACVAPRTMLVAGVGCVLGTWQHVDDTATDCPLEMRWQVRTTRQSPQMT